MRFVLRAHQRPVVLALVPALVLALTAVVGFASPAQATVGPKALTLTYDQQVYGDFLVGGNSVLVCPSGNTACLAGANDTGGTNSAVNDDYAMTPTGAGAAGGTVFDSSSAQITVPSGAKVVYAQLTWAGSMGVTGNGTARCGPNGAASRPTNMPSAATPSNTPVLLKVGANSAVSVLPGRENEDNASALSGNNQQFYSATTDVTSSFANVTTGSPVTISASNVYAYQGYGCMGGWSIQAVYDYGQPTGTVTDKREVFVYDGHVKVSSGVSATANISGFRANGPARVGVVAYEGDNGISGDNFSINGTAQAEPRTKSTSNFFISNATGASTPNYPNNYSVDAKAFDTTAIDVGATSATLQFGSTQDSYLAQELMMSVPVPSLRITKSVSPTTVHSGDTVTWTITVTNPTQAVVSSVAVDDPNVPACNKTIGTLIATQSQTYTCTSVASSDLANTANVSGKDAFNQAISGSGIATLRVLQPNIAITKTADATAYHVGDTVTFTVTVTNTGDTGLTGVAVTDAKTASCVKAIGTLAAGDSTTYTCTTIAPVTGDSNTAAVSGTDSLGGTKGTVSATSTAAAPTIHPAISLTKTASPTTVTAAGQQVTYSFVVTNTSADAPLTGVGITDTLTAPAGPEPTISCPTTSLAPKASTTCTGVYTVTQADVDKGTIHNDATATGTDQVGRKYTSAVASADVTVTRTSALSLVKSANPTSISAIGATVAYAFTVKNTGNTTVTGVAVTDRTTSPAGAVSPTVTCPATTLAPGATTVCTAGYTSTAADFDNGSITDTATAAGTSPLGAVASNASTATVTTVQGPSLTLAKSASPTTITAPGAISYSFAVTNSGTVTVRNLAIADTFTGVSAGDTVPTIACPVTTLAAGATTTCTATYTATQADVDRGTITNSATANGTAPNGTAVASLPSTATVTATRTPKLTLAKSVLPVTAAKAGDVITYSFAVTNSGNVTITSLAIADAMFTGSNAPSCAATSLAPKASTTCTRAYTVTQADVDAGAINNTAAATGTAPDNSTVASPSSSAKVTIAAAPHLTLTKTVSPTSVTAARQNLTYSFLVVNDGNVSVSGLTIADTLAAPAGPALTITCPVTSLAPGASTTCTAPYRTTAADIDNGVITNSATASASTPGGGTVVSNTSTATVTAGVTPALTLTKSASPTSISAVGQTITYTFTVVNSGNVTISGVAIADAQLANVTCLTTTLAAGASTTCSGSRTSTQADLDAGVVTNVATASGTTPKGVPVTSPRASATVTVNAAAALTLQKTASPTSVTVKGSVVTYSFRVTNTGNITVSALSITDVFAAPAGPGNAITCQASVLAPNAATTCTTTYTTTQADIDFGSVTNTATAGAAGATGGTITSNTSTATVSTSPSPGLTLTKSVAPTTASTAGTTTTYTFAVTNSGNQTISGITIADPMFAAAAITCNTRTLGPGASTTCTATRTLTQADVDAGKVTNTARASGTTVGGTAVTSNASSAQVTIAAAPKLTLTKTPSPTAVTGPNQKVTYSFGVTNAGNVTIRSLAIADTFAAPAGSLDADPVCAATTLAPGATTTCTATYTTTQRDIDAGTVKNTATANGTDPSGNPVASPAANATVTATQKASMTLAKTATVQGGGNLTGSGQKINYQFAVTNTGTVTLSLLGVTDILQQPASRTISATCPTTTVAVGATVQCTASYTVTQDDIDSGSVDNTATASARDPGGNTVTSNPSSASVPVTSTPSVTLSKTASPTTVTTAGQTVTYSFVVTNSGNVRLHGLAISDPMFTGANAATCPVTTLDPGASTTCSASRAVTQADVDRGSVVNTAVANTLSPTNTAVASPSSTATVTVTRAPALTLAKSATPKTVTAAGQTIAYSFVVTNSGNTTVSSLAITDARLPAPNAPTCPAGSLAPGASVTCTATYTVTLADMNRGTIVNTATASGTAAGGATVTSPSASATVDAPQRPALGLTKSTSGGTITRAGQVVTYNFDVTDTGNVSVTVLAIIDRLTAPAGPPLDPITCGDTTLVPNQTTRCTATYTVLQADVDNGSINNTAFARAQDPSGTLLVSPTSTATVPITAAPALSVVKSADRTSVTAAGQQITYSFAATNNGNVTLSLLAIQDTFTKGAGPALQVTCPNRTLAPGATGTCTGTYTVTQADLDAGSIANVATATAQQPGGATVTSPPSNGVVVAVTQTSALSIVKTASRATVTAAGQSIDYQFRVTNTGNTTITTVAVADAMFPAPSAPVCPVTTLAPGAAVTCTAGYQTTQADIDSGGITNTARATGTDPNGTKVTSAASTVTVGATARAHLTLVKSANPQTITVIGTQVTYSFTVTNDGNVTVSALAIADPMFTGPAAASCPTRTLAPGDAVVCTATYTSTAADFNRGSITNTATASGATATAGPVTSGSSTATVTATQNPALTLVKSASPRQVDTVGQVVTYSFALSNTGNTTVTSIAVNDPMFTGANAATCPVSSLDAGATTTCTARHTVTQADLDAASGRIDNTATATGVTTPGGTRVTSPPSSTSVDVNQAPSLTLTKSANPSTISAPGQITYSFLVTNTGNVTVTVVGITDPRVTNTTCPQPTLAPRAAETCTGTYSATQADVDQGSIRNTANAFATAPDGSRVESPSSTALVTVTRSPALTLTKTVTSAGPYTAVGQPIAYRFELRNTGNVTVTKPSVTDTLTAPAAPPLTLSCPATAALAPGAPPLVCTASYSITQADVEQGSVSNAAVGAATAPNGDAVASNTSTATVPIAQTTGLTLVKTVSPTTIANRGDRVTYTFTVTNTGNTAVHNLVVTDTLTAPAQPGLTVNCPTTDLGPAGTSTASVVCTANYSAKQADVDRGRIDNSAVASGTGPGGRALRSAASTAVVTIPSAAALTVLKTASPTTVSTRGQTVAYTFVVTNTGNVTLSGIGVTDVWTAAPGGESAPTVTCPVDTLAPGATTTCTAAHDITQADLDLGRVANSATATGTPPSGPTATSDPSTAAVTATQSPNLSLVKSAQPGTVASTDDTITYSFLVTNSGNVTVGGLAVSDAFAGGAALAVGCPVRTLAPGAATTCTATYRVTQADLDAGTIANTATAAGTGPAGQAATSNSSSAVVDVTQGAALTLRKSVTPSTVTRAGTTVHYSFAVTNSGNVTVAGLTIDDTLSAPASPALAITCPVQSLAPRGTTTCTADYVVQQADVDHGSVDNSAVARGRDPKGVDVVSDPSTATVTIPATNTLTIVKTADPTTVSAANQTVTYSFLVTNTGNTTIRGIAVADTFTAPAGPGPAPSCPSTTLRPGVSTTCTDTYRVSQADVDHGGIDNSAVANGVAANGSAVSSTASAAHVGVTQTSALTLVKRASVASVAAVGDTITYSFVLTNTGNVTLSGVTVADQLVAPAGPQPDVVCPQPQAAGGTVTLAPGATTTCTAEYVVTQADLDNGSVDNTAQASGTGPSGAAITSNSSQATVGVVASPALTLTKNATVNDVDGSGGPSLNDTITWTFTVTNSGNVTLDPVSIADPTAGPVTCPAGGLAPGDDATCTANSTHTITQGDVDNGKVTNTAVASGTGGGKTADSPPATSTVTIAAAPALTVVKSADPPSATKAGQTISFAFLVTNTGNVTLRTVTIADTLVAPAAPALDVACPAGALAPQAATMCTATYTVTQADVDNGSITNTAFARAQDPSGTSLRSASSTASVPIAAAAALSVVKSASPTTVTAAGQQVTYSFVATNNGNVTLSLLAISDTFTKGAGPEVQVTCPNRTVAPGANATCTGVYVVTQADVDAGSIENVATARAQQPGGTTITSPPSNAVVVGVTATPGLTIVKTASRPTVTAAGQQIDYRFRVTNSGNTTIGSVAVVDPTFPGAAAPSCPVTSLAPGVGTTCTASYRTTQADIDDGVIVNTAHATGTDPSGTAVRSPDSSVTVTATARPNLVLTKTADPQTITTIGAQVTYTFSVLNNGNVTVSELAVDDPMFRGAAAAECPTGSLAPGDTAACTATYAATAADFTAGTITNTATVNAATPDGSRTVSNESSATVTAVRNPALIVVKKASPTRVSSVGQVITYTFAVSNPGNTTVNDLVVNDSRLDTAPVCDRTSLPAGQDTNCTATYAVTQADLDAPSGRLDNTATVSGVTSPTGDPVLSPPSSTSVQVDATPALTLTKTADPSTISKPTKITYSFLVTNTGNVSVSVVGITDPRVTDARCPVPTLAPQADETCTGTYTATQADVDRGSIRNTATAFATTPTGVTVDSPASTAVVDVTRSPALTLTKTITSDGPYDAVGSVIAYRFELSNSGNVTVTNPSVVDTLSAPAGPPLALDCPDTPSLAPSATLVCTADYTVAQPDLEQGTVDNSAVGGATAPDGAAVPSNVSTASATLTRTSGLTILKTATPTQVNASGDGVRYTFTVTNTGNTSVRGLIVADTLTPPAGPEVDPVCPTTELGPAGSSTATVVCTADYTATQDDVDHGRIDNSAVASAVGPGGAAVLSDASTATVTVPSAASLTVDKTATPATVDTVGQQVEYRFVVTNTGNVTLTGVDVADAWTDAPDDEPLPTIDCPTTTLAPRADTECTATHTVTQADLDHGRLANSATATGTPPTGEPVTSAASSAAVTAQQNPGLTLLKTASPQTVARTTDTVTYTFDVANSGNVTVDDIAVTDTFDATGTALRPVTCDRTTLAPGTGTSCHATYRPTQADLDRGSITNTATAAATDPTGRPTTSNPSSAAVGVAQGPALTLVKTADPKTVARAGASVHYEFVVTNAGNVTITDLTVDDTFTAPAAPALRVTCPVTSLLPTGSTTCTADYTVTQADADRGRVDNSAIARGRDSRGQDVASDPSTATVTITPQPALTVDKSAAPTTVTSTDDRVAYQFVVTNTGNVTLTDVGVLDAWTTAPAGEAAPTVTCPVTRLTPGADTTCTAAHDITQADLDLGRLVNSATASGTPPTGPVVTSDPSTATVSATATPAITLLKTADPASATKAGQTVTFSFLVANTGNVTLSTLTIADRFTAPAGPALQVTCPGDDLAPGANATCTADYTVTQDDVDNGSIDNSATATATAPDSTQVSADSTASVPIGSAAALTVSKSASPKTVTRAGVTVTYSFAVRNTGNTTVHGLSIADTFTAPAGPAVTPSCPTDTLGPDATTTCTADYRVSQADVDHGGIDNSAVASGLAPDGTRVRSLASAAHVDVPQAPALTLVKTASARTVAAVGDEITYSFLVTNTGNVTLSAVTVADHLAAPAGPDPDVVCPPPPGGGDTVSLAPQGKTTCTARYVVTQADLDAGSIDNTAQASGRNPGGTAVPSDPSAVSVGVASNPVLGLVKHATLFDADRNGAPSVDDTITWTFTLTNNGNVTLTALTVDDPDAGAVSCPPGGLAPGADATCTASERHRITQGDVDRGVVSNTATASATDSRQQPVDSPSSTATVTIPAAPSITLVKSATPASATKAGDGIAFSFLVTNTGNVTLHGVTIADTLTAPAGPALDVTCPTGDVAPTADTTCTADYTVTQADVDNGSIDNAATATANAPSGAKVTDGSTASVPIAAAPALTLTKTADPTTVHKAGVTVAYSFVVTNTGNVTVDDIKIADTFAVSGTTLSPSCPVTTLAPQGKTTCDATYTVTQSDVDRGSIKNSATASATDPTGGAVRSNTPTATVTVPANAALTLTKTADPQTVTEIGQTINYTFEVTNTGNVTLHDIAVADTFDATGSTLPVDCPAGDLAPDIDQPVTCTATYHASAADFDRGSIRNTATATGVPPAGTPVVSNQGKAVVETTQNAALTLTKNARFTDLNGDGVPDLGDVIRWSFTLTNSGNVTLHGLAVNDPIAGAVTCPATVAAGADATCTADVPHVITQADVDAGRVDNTATASGTPPNGAPVTSNPSSTSTPIGAQPGVSLTKSGAVVDRNGNGRTDAGDQVRWTFAVVNTGNVTLTGVVIDDPTGGHVTCAATTLRPGARTDCVADAVHTLTQADVNAGSISDTATVRGVDPGNTPVDGPPSTATVPLTPAPGLSLSKSGYVTDQNDDGVNDAGDLVTWLFHVTNTGNTTVHDIAVRDADASDIRCPHTTLEPGQSMTCRSASRVITADEANTGRITNTATVTGVGTGGQVTSSAPSSATLGTVSSNADATTSNNGTASPAAGGGATGGPAYTGARDLALLVWSAVVLLGLGMFLLAAGTIRRRRRA